MPLAGRPLVEWSIAAFRECPSVGAIVIACPPGGTHDLGEALTTVEGGETRAISVSNALREVKTELVAIHDAARPLVTPELIEGVVSTLVADPEAVAAIAATPVTDTIKQSRRSMHSPHAGVVNASSGVEKTLERERLWAAQTPQVFRVAALRKALAGDPEQVAAATDESMLVEAAGGKVLIRRAPPENLKVTTRLDLRLAELLLADAPDDAGRRGDARRRG